MIRAARQSELGELSELAIRSKASWGYSPEFMSACQFELQVRLEGLARNFVLEEGGTIVGFYTLQVASPETAELGHLFVAAHRLRRGHGRELLEHAISEARRAGYKRLRIQGDPNAAPFYEACGARRIGEEPSESIPGRMLPLFEITL